MCTNGLVSQSVHVSVLNRFFMFSVIQMGAAWPFRWLELASSYLSIN